MLLLTPLSDCPDNAWNRPVGISPERDDKDGAWRQSPKPALGH